MTILQHLEELRQRTFKILWVIMPLFLFYMTFTIRVEEFLGLPFPYPWPDFYNAISVMVVRGLMDNLLPDFVQRVQLNPWEAILVQFKVSLFLAVLTAMPWMVFQLTRFVAPGLYQRERRIITRITVPATLLFAAGVLVAYLFILPFTFEFLYGVGLRMGLTPFVGPDQFFDITLLFFIGMGLAFQIPVIMWGLAALGVIGPDFWKRNWRYSVVGFFVFGAIITPDGSGITMMLVAIPMCFLYAGGYFVALRTWKRRAGYEPPEGRERRSSIALWSVIIVVVAMLAGGFAYYNQGIFAPPGGTVETELATGAFSLQVPAYVLYSPQPFAPDIRTGTWLGATDKTTINLQWSAGSEDGKDVILAFEGPQENAIRPIDGGHDLTVYPALWNSSDVDTLDLAATNGNSSVYVLSLDIAYRLLLRRDFSDVDRDSVLDSGEVVHREYFVISYVATPTGEGLVELAASRIQSPSGSQLTLIRKGVFSSTGSGWRLETSISDIPDGNLSYGYVERVEDPILNDYGIHLFMTRSSRWTESEDLTTWITGETSVRLSFTFYVDLRFGAIYPVLEPSVPP